MVHEPTQHWWPSRQSVRALLFIDPSIINVTILVHKPVRFHDTCTRTVSTRPEACTHTCFAHRNDIAVETPSSCSLLGLGIRSSAPQPCGWIEAHFDSSARAHHHCHTVDVDTAGETDRLLTLTKNLHLIRSSGGGGRKYSKKSVRHAMSQTPHKQKTAHAHKHRRLRKVNAANADRLSFKVRKTN